MNTITFKYSYNYKINASPTAPTNDETTYFKQTSSTHRETKHNHIVGWILTSDIKWYEYIEHIIDGK